MSTGISHVPVIPLFDVVGKAANRSPSQIGGTAVNSGTTLGITVIVKVGEVPH